MMLNFIGGEGIRANFAPICRLVENYSFDLVIMFSLKLEKNGFWWDSCKWTAKVDTKWAEIVNIYEWEEGYTR